MKKKQTKVIYTNKGLASYFGDRIEINKNLKYNKPLRDYIVKHELGHSMKFDLGYEVSDGLKLIFNRKIAVMLIKFMMKNPSAWVDFLPIQIRNKKLIYDLNLLLLYISVIVIILISILYLF